MFPEVLQRTTDINQLIQEAKETFQFLISPQLQEKLFGLKIVFIVVSVLFVLAIVYFLKKSSYLKEAMLTDFKELSSFRTFGQAKIVKRWAKIKKRLKKGSEAQRKLALIEALQMFDQGLQRTGYRGENLNERLSRLTEDDIPDLKSVISTIQVCQDITRDPDYQLDRERAEEILNTFEKALKDLQVF